LKSKSKTKEHQPHYIGFHTTTSEAAISSAHSEFKVSGTVCLGKGAYFARSIDGTINKARGGKGARFLAEVRMGKMYEVERQLIDKKHRSFNPEVHDYVYHSK
jgi:hypothetical protein